MVKKSTAPLEPADVTRCQVMIRSGSFMTLGGQRQWERCSAAPVVIVAEVRKGKDGRKGCMSMCDSCLEAFKKINPNWKRAFTFAPIKT